MPQPPTPFAGAPWTNECVSQALEGQAQLLFGCLGELAARIGVRTPVQHAMFGGYVSVITGLTEFVLSIIAGEYYFVSAGSPLVPGAKNGGRG